MSRDLIVSSLTNASKPSLSFEFFPPKDEAGAEALWASFDHLAELKPNFVSVTYGAMGSNQESSLQVVERFAARVPTIAHLTCIGASKASISNLLQKYSEFGVAGLLALRGDVPQGQSAPTGDFTYALDLVRYATELSELEIGVAAFPEKHPESQNLEDDTAVLKLKSNAGATFAMTQLFFTAQAYFSLVERNNNAGINLPIVPGVMPIANARQVLRMAQMSGAAVPASLESALISANNDEEARRIGMQYSSDLARELIAGGAPGLHIFTLNQSRAASELVSMCGLA